jgi:hypothetical protein
MPTTKATAQGTGRRYSPSAVWYRGIITLNSDNRSANGLMGEFRFCPLPLSVQRSLWPPDWIIVKWEAKPLHGPTAMIIAWEWQLALCPIKGAARMTVARNLTPTRAAATRQHAYLHPLAYP